MAQLPILQYPHPALRSTSAPVQHFDQELWSLLDNLKDTLYATPGIGLCAPQVSELKQVVVMDLSDDNSALEEYINPEIITHSGHAICLQHELDHLEGKLFIDRISALRRLPMRGRLAAMNQTQLPATA